jgi:hypothetical protein
MASDADTLRQLVDLVTKLRAAQRAYFKTHGGLDECRKIERAVDRWLAQFEPGNQRRLFGRKRPNSATANIEPRRAQRTH